MPESKLRFLGITQAATLAKHAKIHNTSDGFSLLLHIVTGYIYSRKAFLVLFARRLEMCNACVLPFFTREFGRGSNDSHAEIVYHFHIIR